MRIKIVHMWRWAEELSWHRVEYTYGHVYPKNVILYLNYLLGDPTRWIRGSWGFQICKQNFSTTKIDGAMAIWKSTKFSIFRQKIKNFGSKLWKRWVFVKMRFLLKNVIFWSKISKNLENLKKNWKILKKLNNLEKSQKKFKKSRKI